MLVVQKYGGSSLADAGKISHVAKRIARTREQGHRVVVVCSAMGDTTDDLIAEIAAALGVPSRGDALIQQTDAEIAAAREQIEQVAPPAESDKPRMLFLYVRGNANIYYIFGADSGADSLIEAVGGDENSPGAPQIGPAPAPRDCR